MLVCLAMLFIALSIVGVGARSIPSDDAIMPLWDSIAVTTLDIDFDGNTSLVDGTARRQSTVTSIEGTVTVYYYDGGWQYLDSWYGSTTRNSLAVGGEFDAVSGVQYKAVFEVTAYTGNTPESHEMVRTETCP